MQLNGFIGVNISIYAVFRQTWYADGQNATSMLAKLALYYREHRSVSNNQKNDTSSIISGHAIHWQPQNDVGFLEFLKNPVVPLLVKAVVF